VVGCPTCNREVADSNPACAAVVYQRKLSVPSLLGSILLMRTAKANLTGIPRNVLAPFQWSCVVASAGVRLTATGNRDQRRPIGP